MFSGLSNTFSGISSTITSFFQPVVTGIGNIINWLNPLSDDFILKRVITFLGNLVDYINPLSNNFFGRKLVELIGNLLTSLFIPSNDYFQTKFNSIKTAFSQRLSYQSYVDLFESSKNVDPDESISIDMSNYQVGDNTLSVNNFIDFSVFDTYKPVYYGFIRGFTFIFLVIYVINHLYKIIRGESLFNAISDKGGINK